MSYEPFALKYRPRVFEDVVGQKAVADTLRNALGAGRVANAFLFSGSRGVGKTSMARILAKALNCPEGEEGVPCGRCATCAAIAKGEDLDVIEIDGASNRGIDEIRTIRENVGFAPARSRFKVYIIDEVHMLTMPAFNALLKTLEEPPPHVRFIFATTEPRAVPDTIVSRCQRYEFRRIGLDDLVERLRFICEKEDLSAEDEVLAEIARKGEGGLRDALGLLDQLASFSGGEITREDLDRVLGRIQSEVLLGILGPAGEGDLAGVLEGLDRAFEEGHDAEALNDQCVEVLRGVMLHAARAAEGESGSAADDPVGGEIAADYPLDRALLAVRLLLNARREARLVGQGRLQLELALLKIARVKELAGLPEILERLGDGGGPPGGPAGGGGGGRPRPDVDGAAPPGRGGWRSRGPGEPARGAPGRRSWGRASTAEAPGGAPTPSRPAPTGSGEEPAPGTPTRTRNEPAARRPAGAETRPEAAHPAPASPGPARASEPGEAVVRSSGWKPRAKPPGLPRAASAGAEGDAPAPDRSPRELGTPATAAEKTDRGSGPPATPRAPTSSPSEASGPPWSDADEGVVRPVAAARVAGTGGSEEAGTAPEAAGEEAPSVPEEDLAAVWADVVRAVRDERPRVATVLERAVPQTLEGDRLLVELPASWGFQRTQLEGKHRATVENAVRRRLRGRPVRLAYAMRTEAEEQARPTSRRVYEDPLVRKVLDTFGGGVVSIENEERDDEGLRS